MIAYLKGIIAEVTPTRLVLEVNHIGYEIFISAREASELPRRGEEVKIYTYFNVREDAMQLFGFQSEDDLEMYKLLLNVNGVGPKAALGILSVLTADDVRVAVLSDDVKTISKAPGIGKKTAEKTVLELKDKIKLEDAFEEKLQETEQMEENGELQNVRQDATEALVALGYSQTEALKAVRGIDVTPDMDAEQLLKLSLKKLL